MLLNLAVFQRLSSGNILASENHACCLSYLHCRLQLRELEFSLYFVYFAQRFGKSCSSGGFKFLFPHSKQRRFLPPTAKTSALSSLSEQMLAAF